MEFWRRLIAALLLMLYAFSASAAGELLKIPRLVAHYFDHTGETGQNNVLLFLFEHYFVESGTDDDAAEDSELPFKSPVQNANNITAVPPPHGAVTVIPAVTPAACVVYPVRNDWLPASQYLACIWQPPRHCLNTR